MPEGSGVQGILDLLLGIPEALAYAIIALGSAIENIFPPIPSDTFVVLGAVLADRGSLQATGVLLSAWIANTAGAMCVFGLARRHGPAMFRTHWGRRLLRPHQLDRMGSFYERHGLWAIFLSRCLPVLRVIVPTFAGFAGLRPGRAFFPLVAASLLWNALMVAGGILASRNVGRLLDLLGRVNAWLLVVAAIVFGLIIRWWIWSRREDPE